MSFEVVCIILGIHISDLYTICPQPANILDILENGQSVVPSDLSKVGGAADLLDLLGDLGPAQPSHNNVLPSIPITNNFDGLLSPNLQLSKQINGTAGTSTSHIFSHY